MKIKIAMYLLFVFYFGAATAQASWVHQSELGMTDIQGNTESTTFVAKHKSVKALDINTYTASGDYSYGKNDTDTTDATPGVLAVRNWNALLRFDRKINDRFSWFLQSSIFGDKFQNVVWRASYDVPGITYHIIPKSESKPNDFFSADLAYRFSQEELEFASVDPDYEEDNSNAYLALHYSKGISTSLIGLVDLDYTKRLTGDERTVTNLFLGLQNQLSNTFALKVGYKISVDDSIEDPSEDTQKTLTINLLASY